MRFLDLNRYSLLSLTATLVAIAYSSHKSLFHTPTSFLNLGLLKSLEPFLKDVIPFGADSPFSQTSFDIVLTDLLHHDHTHTHPKQQQQENGQYDGQVDSSNRNKHKDTNSVSSHFMVDSLLSSKDELLDNDHEHSQLLEGAAGIGNGFRPSVFQAMLAERYLKFRTPSPAVLLQLQVILSYLQNEKLCVLVFTNMTFCLAFLIGRLLLRTFFGDLRVIERQARVTNKSLDCHANLKQTMLSIYALLCPLPNNPKHMYDRALNFLLFKVVFVGAILEPRWEELLIWTAWFTILGFLRVFSMLCRDRFEYLTVSPNIPVKVHVKILTMLAMILVSNIAWFVFCISVFRSMLLLLSFECFTLLLDTVQTLVKYVIHLGDLSRQGPCESRRLVQYYTEFVTDTMILVTTLGHYLHIMYLHGISFTLIDAVLFLNMRSVFNNLRKKLTSHQAYRQALSNMQALYPSATEKELADYSDDCAICRDSMSSAKVLPCGHIFHLFCIRSWLEHHSSCPTCRRSLVTKTESNGSDSDLARGFPDTSRSTIRTSSVEPLPTPSVIDSHHARLRASPVTTSSLQTIPVSSSNSGILAFSGGHSSSNSTTSSTAHHSLSGVNSNRSSTGHQLFAFNSEQQPWLSRLGFPRITVEVVDPTQDEDENNAGIYRPQQHSQSSQSSQTSQRRFSYQEENEDDEDVDLRRAIAESLAMSQQNQYQSPVPSPSTISLMTTTTETTTRGCELGLNLRENDSSAQSGRDSLDNAEWHSTQRHGATGASVHSTTASECDLRVD
ncbi:hypothetical protein EDD11_000553 [Mortierella claussenii]|nr:hypothetical protein EDD11_000553 [Mortierella claussenii]